MKAGSKSTEELILHAAHKAFTKKGLSGARMQDIANEAGINKALVHYYFESKEKLFTLIFEKEFGKFFSNLAAVIAADIPLFEKIEQIVSLDIDQMTLFPEMPLFVINEVSRNPEMVTGQFKKIRVRDVLGSLQNQVDTEIKKGAIKSISAEQLLINIQSLCIFPFVAKPILKKVMQMTEKQYQDMIRRRKEEVATFIINAISQ